MSLSMRQGIEESPGRGEQTGQVGGSFSGVGWRFHWLSQ